MEDKYVAIFCVNTVNFLVYLALSAFILIKLQFKLDSVSIISMTAVLIGFFCRFTSWLIYLIMGYAHEGSQPTAKVAAVFLLIDALSTSIFHINAYFFCFEMKFVHEQIKSESFEDFKARESRVRRLRNLFMVLAIALQLAFLAFVFKRYYLEKPEENFGTPVYIAYIA